MSKLFTFFSASLCACSIAYADAPMDNPSDAIAEFSGTEAMERATPSAITPLISEIKAPPKKAVEQPPEVNVNPFTGKVKGRKVRLRLRPDLDSRIVKELSKNELITITGERGDFWAVEPPAGTKAYVFRSFILDNVVEGNRVNVRLEPSLDAPIIGHLNSGDKIENPSISPVNPKWFEIAPPANARLYVAKEYVDYAGGPELKEQVDRRRSAAEQIIDATALISRSELRKPFDAIDFDRIVKGYTTVINDFNQFPELVEDAKEALATFQEEYLQKRINHLEELADQQKIALATDPAPVDLSDFPNISMVTDKMKHWEPIEEALYLSWANINDNKTQSDYYQEQKLSAVEVTGIVEPYTSAVKAKPGDFILRDRELPVAYVYSTQVNLQSLVGKQVKLIAAPRPNNNFAFPAYYVLGVE